MATDLERIQAYAAGVSTKPLTEHQEKYYKRIMQMSALILEYMDDQECVEIYCNITGLNQSQGYRDLADAKVLTGDVMAINVKFETFRMYSKLKRTIQKAEDAGKFSAAMSGHRTALEYNKVIAELEMIDLTVYERHTIILTVDPELLPGEREMLEPAALAALVKKLSTPKILIDNDDYSEFEDISAELERGAPGSS